MKQMEMNMNMKSTFFMLLTMLSFSPSVLGVEVKSKPTTVSVVQNAVPIVYATLKDAAQALQPGGWYQLPAKNKMSNVFPAQNGGNWYASGYNPQNVVYSWGGGAVGNGKFFVWGGGHNDYGGNEVYIFDLGTWTWTRATNPSSYVTYPCGSGTACKTTDGAPVSVHSNSGITFIPNLNLFWVGGGCPYSTVGGFTSQSAIFNPVTSQWQTAQNVPYSNGVISAWDPVSQKVLGILGGGGAEDGTFFTYNPTSQKIENLSSKNWSVRYTGDLDFKNRQFLVYDTTRANNMFVYDLSGIDLKPAANTVSFTRFDYKPTFMNGAPFRPSFRDDAPGVAYVPDRSLFALWDGASSDVWTLDPSNWNWKQIKAVNQGPTPSPLSRGVMGRWRYLPEYGVFLAFDNVEQNPWIYKLP